MNQNFRTPNRRDVMNAIESVVLPSELTPALHERLCTDFYACMEQWLEWAEDNQELVIKKSATDEEYQEFYNAKPFSPIRGLCGSLSTFGAYADRPWEQAYHVMEVLFNKNSYPFGARFTNSHLSAERLQWVREVLSVDTPLHARPGVIKEALLFAFPDEDLSKLYASFINFLTLWSAWADANCETDEPDDRFNSDHDLSVALSEFLEFSWLPYDKVQQFMQEIQYGRSYPFYNGMRGQVKLLDETGAHRNLQRRAWVYATLEANNDRPNS